MGLQVPPSRWLDLFNVFWVLGLCELLVVFSMVWGCLSDLFSVVCGFGGSLGSSMRNCVVSAVLQATRYKTVFLA